MNRLTSFFKTGNTIPIPNPNPPNPNPPNPNPRNPNPRNPNPPNPEINYTKLYDNHMIILRMTKKIQSLILQKNDDEKYFYIYKDEKYYFDSNNDKKKFLDYLSILVVIEKALEIKKALEIIKTWENGNIGLAEEIVCENKLSDKIIINFNNHLMYCNAILEIKSPISDSSDKLIDKVSSDLREQMKQEEQVDPKDQAGGKLKKGQKKIKSKKSVVSQNKENKYIDVLGKRMKIYEKPDSRKEFVRYKGELVALVEYKKSMKEIAKKQNAKK